MARGWESKSIEDQQSEAAADRSQSRIRLTPLEIQIETKRKNLELSRLSVEQELAKARHPRHREMLQNALRDLENRLKKLNESNRESTRAPERE